MELMGVRADHRTFIQSMRHRPETTNIEAADAAADGVKNWDCYPFLEGTTKDTKHVSYLVINVIWSW